MAASGAPASMGGMGGSMNDMQSQMKNLNAQ